MASPDLCPRRSRKARFRTQPLGRPDANSEVARPWHRRSFSVSALFEDHHFCGPVRVLDSRGRKPTSQRHRRSRKHTVSSWSSAVVLGRRSTQQPLRAAAWCPALLDAPRISGREGGARFRCCFRSGSPKAGQKSEAGFGSGTARNMGPQGSDLGCPSSCRLRSWRARRARARLHRFGARHICFAANIQAGRCESRPGQ